MSRLHHTLADVATAIVVGVMLAAAFVHGWSATA